MGAQSYLEKLNNGETLFQITERLNARDIGVIVEPSGRRGQTNELRYDGYRVLTEHGEKTLLFVNPNRRLNTGTGEWFRIVAYHDQFEAEYRPHEQWSAWADRTEEEVPRTLRRFSFAPA